MSLLNTNTHAAIIDAPLVYLQTLRVQYKKDTNKESHTGPGADWTSQVHIKGSQDELEYFHNNTATRDGPIREIHVMPNRPAPALTDKHLQWTCPMVNWGEDEAVIATGNWWMFSTTECGLKAPTWKTEQSRQDRPELSRDWIQRNCFVLFFLEEGYNSKFLNMPKAWTECSANKHTEDLHRVSPYVNPHHHIRWKLHSSFSLKSHQTCYIHIPPIPSRVCNVKKLAWLRGKFPIWAAVLGCRLPKVAPSEDLTQQGCGLSNAW